MAFAFNKRVTKFEMDRMSMDYIWMSTEMCAFLGKRFFSRFENILCEGEYDIMKRKISSGEYGKAFEIKLLDINGNPVNMLCELFRSDDPYNVIVCMMEKEAFSESYANLKMLKEQNEAVVNQYDEALFSYDVASGTITCQFDEVDEVFTGTLGEFENKLCEIVSEISEGDIGKFISNIRTGTRVFSFTFHGKKDNREITFTGKSVYLDTKHTKTIGKLGGSPMAHNQINMLDQLTGAYLKTTITDYAQKRIDVQHLRTGIAIIDVDDFKIVNDNFGHAKGDEVLTAINDLLEKCVGDMGKVGRIGGDEFFVVYDNFTEMEDIRLSLMAMRTMSLAIYNEDKCGFNTSLSIGCTLYPDDYNGTFDEMFKLADTFLYRAKYKGKDRYIIYNYDKHGPIEEILKNGFKKSGLDKSEFICSTYNALLMGERLELDSVLIEASRYFMVDRMVLYNKTDRFARSQCGVKKLSIDKIRRTIDYIYDDMLNSSYTSNGTMVRNNIEYFTDRSPFVYEKLKDQGIISIQHYTFKGRDGKDYVLSCEAVNMLVSWNLGDIQYYHILTKILSQIV